VAKGPSQDGFNKTFKIFCWANCLAKQEKEIKWNILGSRSEFLVNLNGPRGNFTKYTAYNTWSFCVKFNCVLRVTLEKKKYLKFPVIKLLS